jgi:D-3-phosphoglycerate dehydrogenase
VKVLLLDNWTPEARGELAKVCEVRDGSPGNWIPEPTWEVFEGIVARIPCKCDEWLLEKMPNVRFVATCTTGLDHIDVDYCKSRNIAVLSLQGDPFLREVHGTAEHTVALMLSLLRRIPQAHKDVCEGRWDREAWQGSELHGKTVGIVGLGRVGMQVMHLVKAFGAETVWKDVGILGVEESRLYDACECDALEYLLRESDIVTLHVPLNDSTRGMIGAKELAQMKPTAYLVNTSRGAVVDEEALVWALREGRIAGAALDVLVDEPYINDELADYARERDNLVLTPHIGGNTSESRLKTQLRMVEKIREFLGGVRHDACTPAAQASEGGVR